MALVLQDRVREISTTTGTGTVTLSGAYPGGYRTFASCVPNGSTVYYCIHNTADGYQTEWEVGYGTYSSNTLTRTSVLSSSNSDTAVNFSAGDKEVFITYPAEKAVYEEVNGETLIDGGPITVVGSNVTSLPTLPAELGKFVGNIDLFAQIYNYNQNSGSNASADFVAYNSDTDVNGTTFFVDMGINSPNYSSVDYPIFTPHSGYVFSYGDANTHPSTLFLGSGDNDVRIFAGGLDSNATVATFGTDLSTTLEGALDVGSTLNVTGVTTLSALAYTSGNIAAAANNTVLVTKAYVDDATSNGFHVHTPVLVATTGNLTASYNNGTSGVGATLTNSGAQVALSIDGVAMNVADRVLVWQQTTGTQNGVYVVTTVGSGSTNWVLTRSSDADTSSEGDPNSLGGGDYFFVESGSTLGYHSYICNNTGAITFGTTNITFAEFSSVPAYTGGTNINVDGQVISITGTVGPTNGGTGVNTVTTGDLLYGSATNTWSKLAKGTAYKSLVMNAGGTQVEWNAVALNASGAVSGVLSETNGGTNNSTYTLGDTLYSSAANTLAKLAGNTTTTKKYMQQQGNGSVSAAPSWQQIAAADISGLAASATTDTTNASNISSGTLANARTTASSSNGASTIVARDASGNFTANSITATLFNGTLIGSASSLSSAQNFQISGGATAANVSFNGTGAVNLNVTAMNASVINTGTIGNAYTTASSSNGASTIVARDASGNFSANTITATQVNTSGAGITSLNASVINSGTIGNAYTTGSASNGASTLVLRDASGNFAANTITATLTGTASNATVLQTARNVSISGGATAAAVSFNGSAAVDLNVTAMNASLISAGTLPSARVSGSYTSITGVGTLTAGTWNASAISDTYLSTISTAGKVSNSATTASSSNGASTIVARDASGNFSANTVTAALSGNASTATTLQTARTIAIGTGATGTATSFNGSADITIPITDVNASYIGTGTLANARTTASSSNGASTIVARDASGNFTGNTITAVTGFSGPGGSLTALNATALSQGTVATGRISGSYTGITGVGTLTAGTWNATAISDTYLSTISTAGKVSNSATTASSSNGASTIVARDASGNFSAGTITATLNGNASTATSATSATSATTAGNVTGIVAVANGGTGSNVAATAATNLGLGTGSNVQFSSLGVGTAASGTAGEIRATNNITAYYSDERLKTKIGSIENALEKVKQIETMVYHANETAVELGYDASKIEVGVTAQSVQRVQPEAVKPAPIDEKYLTVQYERLVPLLIEAIKELEAQVAELKAK